MPASTATAPEAAGTAEADPPDDFPSAVAWIEPDAGSQYQAFPLTDIQQAYWIGRHGTNGSAGVATYAYTEMEIEGLDVARYQAALNQLIRRHHMLRMVVREDGLQQFLDNVPTFEITVEDMRGRDAQGIEARLADIRDTMSHQVLDPTVWPLFQLRVSRLPGERYRLHYGFDFLIVDVLSLLVFFRDMFLLYIGEDTRLQPLQLSYRDYVLHEQASRASQAYERSKAYWMSRVGTLPSAPALPFACDPHSITTPKYARRDFELDPETWGRIKAGARRHKVTPSVVIAAAFSEVLAQWCSSPHFTLNLTLFNRPRLHPQMNDLIGDFTSSVLLEVDMAEAGRFDETARAIQAQLMGDLEHRHFSGVEFLRARNSQLGGYQASVMPIVLTSALGLDQHAESRLAGLGDDQLALYEEMMTLGHTISQTSQVYLDHVVREKSGRMLCNWDALEALFPGRVLDDMFCAYYDRLISLADGGDAAWRSLRPTALPMAQQQARERVNATEAPVSDELLQQLFVRTAEAQPDRPAVINGDVRLSYKDLHVAATHLGRHLRAQGIQPNQLVGVVMDKGWEQIVAVMGILFSGAAYMPVDASLPAERIRQLLLQGEVGIALTQAHLADAIDWPSAVQAQAIRIEHVAQHRNHGVQPIMLPMAQKPTDLAYVLFTSGSTGTPKGVMIDHRSAVNTVLDINLRFDITDKDRVLAINALNFDLSVYDVFGLLAAGGTLVMPLAGRALDPAHWDDLVRQEGVTLWNTVPALAQLYVEALAENAGASTSGEGERPLRWVFMSGDWIPVGLPDRIRAVLPEARPVSLGGPTETTVWSIYYPIGEVPAHWKSIPYGKPLSNRSHHVLHADLTPCPDWVAGDIYTGGRIGLSQGYWRDPQRTAQAFVRHPATGEPLYKTGDVGRFLPDGNIEFIGRSDFQVKVQGHRIELGEIEHALRQCEGVQDALVVAINGAEGQSPSAQASRLVAYVVEKGASDEDRDMSRLIASSGVMMDPMARAAFKLTQAGLRRFGGDVRVFMLPHALDHAERLCLDSQANWHQPASEQRWADQPLSLAQLGMSLSCLCQVKLPDAALPKYYYPSAGSAHPIQSYLLVKPGAVRDLPAGIYYHDAQAHRLVTLPLVADVAEAVLMRVQASRAGVVMLLVSHDEAIMPLYGDVGAERFAPIEAGHMMQLLRAAASPVDLGLARVPAYDGEAVPALLGLDGRHRLMACLTLHDCKASQGGRTSAPACQQLDLLARQSFRHFAAGPVEAQALAALMAHWQGMPEALQAAPDICVYIKPGRVKGMAPGLYRYERQGVAAPGLKLVQQLDEGLPGNLQYLENGRIHEASAFSILFLRDTAGASNEALLATGELAQTLLNVVTQHGLGLCSTGGGKVELVRGLLGLSGSIEICHCLEGGAIASAQLQRWDNTEPVPVDARQLWRDALAGKLPYYMVPSQFVKLASFPLTANGKVDRKALSRMADAAPTLARELVAPRDELESLIHAVWLKHLELAEASIHDNLFESGGDSLIATKMIAEIGQTVAVNLPLHKVFADPTIAGIADQYRVLLAQAAPSPDATLRTEDVLGGSAGVVQQMRRDAVLDVAIDADMRKPPRIEAPASVLLTGASGYLGAHVLRALLDQTTAQVHCLVRADSDAEAFERVRANLMRHELWRSDDAPRVKAWAGDLARPMLGLPPAVYRRLSTEVDVIHHVGAQVNYARAYADMRGANVMGARSVIELALTGKLKAVNVVSTKYVCFELGAQGVSIQGHEGPIVSPDGMFVGYTQSKWVSEQLFQQAGELGVPVAIIRPGQITASATGAVHWPEDAFHSLVEMFQGMGTRPQVGEWADGAIDVVPVDYCAAAIVAIGAKPDSYGRHFHLVNPAPMSMDAFFDALQPWQQARTDADVRGMPFEHWAGHCLDQVASMDDRVTAHVLEKFFVPTQHGRLVKGLFVNAPLMSDNLRKALEGSGVSCPPVSETLWARYLDAPSRQRKELAMNTA
jgi:amino acid adenylation domain-containing protein/thioester reductase-like protein